QLALDQRGVRARWPRTRPGARHGRGTAAGKAGNAGMKSRVHGFWNKTGNGKEHALLRLAERTTRIASSPTQQVTATVDHLRREGMEVLDFGAGEPDFPTPESVKAAARQALDQDFTKYTPNLGIAELRRAICDRYRKDYGVEYSEPQVIVTAGGKQ